MPGFYMLQNYGARLKDFSATGEGNKPVELSVVDEHTWKINSAGTKQVTLRYSAPLEFQNGVGHYSGIAAYVYVVGLCLDLELLAQTGGKRSLDDVELALWKKCRNNQPGFAEDEIRKQLIVAGGDTFGPLYDKLVLTPGELPVEKALAHVGLELTEKSEIRSVAMPTEEQLRLRKLWLAKKR